MQHIWESIKNYYIAIGKNYHVDPVIFLGIHVVATPLFVFCVTWLVKSYRKKKPFILPLILCVIIFNAANIYLVAFGKNLEWWIYVILGTTTLISGYFSYLKIRKKINE